ncbi:MAG TPA: ribosome small subunit-dependent GTPase A [Clostridiaceae bacterium]|nr:ribosome small subunit-dependent GTPase A [Clostridiaceae bacterium]
MPSGIITKGIGGFYYVESDEGVFECKARGIFRKDGIIPLPGDKVGFTIIDKDKKVGNIDRIMPRFSQLIRPSVANVDQVIIVISVKSPSADFMLLDKLLITAERKELAAVVCINKIDLDVDNEHKNIMDIYASAKYKVIATSLKKGIGLDSLREVLQGKISVLAGQSGVGKSTIINGIMNAGMMKTGELSAKIDRGKHTTRHAELIKLQEGGYIVDTPGFSNFDELEMQAEELQYCYPEFRDYINLCRFTHCSHISEPDCGVKEALSKGHINTGRYSRYIQLYNYLKQKKKY